MTDAGAFPGKAYFAARPDDVSRWNAADRPQPAVDATVPEMRADCLVAAAAAQLDASLATRNARDFPMPEITVEPWPVGE